MKRANGYYQRVSKKCASCRYKDIENDGTRVCLKMGLKVEQTFCCQQWQMSDGLKRAGMQNGGVVLRERSGKAERAVKERRRL